MVSVSYQSIGVFFFRLSSILRRLYLSHVPAPSAPSAPGFGSRVFTRLRSIANTAPSIPTLEKICHAFGISLSAFFEEPHETEEEHEVVSLYRRLEPRTQQAVLYLMRAAGKNKF